MLSISSLSGGGAEKVVSIWASHLADSNNVCLLLSYREKNEYQISNKVEILSISETKKEYDSLSLLQKASSRKKIIQRIKPDVVIPFLTQVQVMTYLSMLFIRGIEVIETVRNSPWEDRPNNYIYRRLIDKCFDSCDAVIVQCKEQKEYFPEYIQSKCFEVWNPIEEHYFGEKSMIKTGNPLEIVAVGRLCQQKNYFMMIEVIRKLSVLYPDITLDIYGIGEQTYYKQLKDKVDDYKLNKNVRLMGRANQMENTYKKYGMFIMTSNYEGMPNALLEAMAAGLLCIVTDCRTGPKDLIIDGVNGFLTPMNNADVMSDRIRQVISIEAAKQTIIRRNAIETIRAKCSYEVTFKQLDHIFEQLSDLRK